MQTHPHLALPARDPAGDGERQRHADHERERGLNQVVQRTTDPLDVGLVMAKKFPKAAFRQRFRHATEMEHLAHHQEHDEAAKRIEGSQTWR